MASEVDVALRAGPKIARSVEAQCGNVSANLKASRRILCMGRRTNQTTKNCQGCDGGETPEARTLQDDQSHRTVSCSKWNNVSVYRSVAVEDLAKNCSQFRLNDTRPR